MGSGADFTDHYPDDLAPLIRILLATGNPHKLREVRRILETQRIEVVSPADLGLEYDPTETGTTFQQNARLKAERLADRVALPVVADDSGLEVVALGGAPGVLSARYGGPGLDDAARTALVLGRMQQVPESLRGARFVAAVALAVAGRPTVLFERSVKGRISSEARGSAGFGYDPIFYYPPLGKTFAQLQPVEKASISHRGQAFRALAAYLLRSEAGDILGRPSRLHGEA
jgi:XTP/dITP diphosphohydrolase